MKNLIVSLLLALPCVALSQEFRGTISGIVSDPSGSPISGAQITVLETQTGTRFQVKSDTGGKYTAPFLLPGDYDVLARHEGFKEFTRKAIHIGAGDHPDIDVQLQVGDATQSVEVTADAPLLNSENASLGQAITTKEVEDLPLNGRSPIQLAQLSIGVIPSPFNSSSTVLQPYDSSNNFSVGGTATQTSEMLLDGAPNATWDMRSAWSPMQDAVQEVRVKAFDTDSAFGHTGGGTLNLVLKSGTNSVHGSLYEFTQPSVLTANSWFNNRNGLGNPVTHFNQYGATAGGPVWIPKIYDGRNKLFWFVGWEGDKNSMPNTNFLSVPTPAEKRGDFSQILNTDGTKLYDPYSGMMVGTAIQRTAYPNNQIPMSEWNPIALNYLKFYPNPNVNVFNTTSLPDGYDNFGTTAVTTNNFNNELGRLDFNLSEKNRIFFDVRHNALFATKNNYFQNISTGSVTNRENWGTSLDEVYILNPSNILNVRLNYTYLYEDASDPGLGANPASYGFPSYIAANSERVALPYLYFSTATNVQALGSNAAAKRPSQSLTLFASWTRIHGNHTFKFGTDARQVPAQYDYLPGVLGFVQLRRQFLGHAQQYNAASRHGSGRRFLASGVAIPGLLRHQHLRFLVFVLRLWIRAGRLACQPQSHRESGHSFRSRWSVPREIWTHGERLQLQCAEPSCRRGNHRLQSESGAADSSGRLQRSGWSHLSFERRHRSLPEHVAPGESPNRRRLVAEPF